MNDGEILGAYQVDSAPITLNATGTNRCLLCQQVYPASDELKTCPQDGSLLVPVPQDQMIGQVLDGKYRIEKHIGSGGWSRVYKAFHVHLHKHVAVKVLDSNMSDDPDALRRFELEARSTYSLVHPGIVAVYDHGVMPQPYIVMELVDGQTVEQVLEERLQLSVDEALPLFEAVCSTMEHAHKAGFIHRDLKPSNIMLTRDGAVKVLDFGLVKSIYQTNTQEGETVGSPPYMSPEQCKGLPLDARSDIYSMGCIMYEVLTGIRAFTGETAIECMYKHFTQTPVALRDVRGDIELPDGLERIVGKAIEVECKHRFQTMEALRQDLQRVTSGTVKARWNRHKARYSRTVYSAAYFSKFGCAGILFFYILINLPIWIARYSVK